MKNTTKGFHHYLFILLHTNNSFKADLSDGMTLYADVEVKATATHSPNVHSIADTTIYDKVEFAAQQVCVYEESDSD